MEKTQPRIEIIFKETYRQSLHSAVAFFIIPLRWLGFYYAICFSISAFLWNLFIMPKWFSETLRKDEKIIGYSRGMLIYPITILILALLFPLNILAGAWAVLSIADGLATFTGKLFGKKSLPWNKNKTWLGSMVFFLSATIFGALALIWTSPNIDASSFIWQNSSLILQPLPPFKIIFLFSSLAGLISAITESLPLKKIDDNLLSPFAYSIIILVLFLLISH